MIHIKEDSVLFMIKALDKSIIKSLLNGKIEFIPPTQVEIIEYILNSCGKKVYQRELEKILCLSRATVSSVLMTMEKNNLIKRVADENDARSKQIILNDIAKERFSAAKLKLKEINDIMTRDLNNDELEIFLSIINKMKNNIDNYNNK